MGLIIIKLQMEICFVNCLPCCLSPSSHQTWQDIHHHQLVKDSDFFSIFTYLIWLRWVLVVACRIFDLCCCMARGIFSCSMWTFSCSMWVLVLWPGIEPRTPELGAWSLSHWTTREVSGPSFWFGLVTTVKGWLVLPWVGHTAWGIVHTCSWQMGFTGSLSPSRAISVVSWVLTL